MTCTHCANPIDPGSAYCRFCGTPVAPPAGAPRRLTRRPDDGRVAGVCAGLAVYLDTDVALVRFAWVILSILPGALLGGALAYVVAWMLMPVATGPAPAPLDGRRLTRSRSDRKIAGVCGGLAAYLGVDPTMVRLAWAVLTVVPGAIICGVLAYVVAWFVVPNAAEPSVIAPPLPV